MQKNAYQEGQAAVYGGRQSGEAISREVCLDSVRFCAEARLTKELDAQFEESEKLEAQIRQNLWRIDYGE
jgi:hypothetical protein